MASYRNLRAEMARRDYTQKDIADALSIRIATANAKINGKSHFTLDEAHTLWQSKFPDCNFMYLFEDSDKTA
jgi:plasmid maintenance system antidote protein VapI